LGFASAPGFLIANNTIDDLIGGIFGGGDAPFVDFSGGAHTFSAVDVGGTQLLGSLAISRIPEPATIALLGAGLLGIGATRKKSKSSAATK
jgi:hypothetical protein